MTIAMEEEFGISIFAVAGWDGGGWVGDIAASSCTRKRSGEEAEAAFLHKATSLGMSVAKPWGDSERYDLIVGSGRRLWRVQVKSTRYVGERRFSITARGCTAPYTEEEIDFLAAYIVPLDLWYVVPVKAFAPSKCLRFYPEGNSSRGQYEKYREAWWLMESKDARASRIASEP
ncbi:MAG TPA: group I intron-associated PD-(D/E)XK endonuclease [Terriglobales bacterium]|nr:group I intron-associated PD-(D/E)XK endonuclease [Terriglobales bacterium]